MASSIQDIINRFKQSDNTERTVKPQASLKDILSRNETIGQGTSKKKTKIGQIISRFKETGFGRAIFDPLTGVEDVQSGLLNADKLKEETFGGEIRRKGVLGGFFGVKSRDQKILDREVELQKTGIEPGRAAQIAFFDVPENATNPLEAAANYESNKDRRKRLQEEFQLTEDEEKAIKRVALFEQIDVIGNTLDVATFGATTAPRKAIQEVIEQVAKEGGEDAIKAILKNTFQDLIVKRYQTLLL